MAIRYGFDPYTLIGLPDSLYVAELCRKSSNGEWWAFPRVRFRVEGRPAIRKKPVYRQAAPMRYHKGFTRAAVELAVQRDLRQLVSGPERTTALGGDVWVRLPAVLLDNEPGSTCAWSPEIAAHHAAWQAGDHRTMGER